MDLKVEKIHEDSRGSITAITVGEREFLLLKTSDCMMRGADIHKSAQHDLVLLGRITWIKGNVESPAKLIVDENEMVTTEKGVPHMLISRGESLVLEWLDKPELERVNGKFTKTFYQPYRKLVEASK
jgi:mannose-6-phosphate isomerase-like protein (cupin superfamily)